MTEANTLVPETEPIPALPASADTDNNDQPEKPYLVIEPEGGWAALNLKEIWDFRDLMFTLASRDLKVRYKQTALGTAWIILQPLMAAGVLSFIFGKVAKLDTSFLDSYAGMLGWNVFSNTLNKTSGSMTGNAHLISKVYFPRLVLPFSGVISTLVDFTVALGMLIVIMLFHHKIPGLALLTLPIWLALLVLMGMGIGLIAAAGMVHYRDVGAVLGLIMQLLFYVSPIAYTIAAVPEKYKTFFYLNPVSPLLEAVRWSTLNQASPPWLYLAATPIITAALFLGGAVVFKRMERKFVDVI